MKYRSLIVVLVISWFIALNAITSTYAQNSDRGAGGGCCCLGFLGLVVSLPLAILLGSLIYAVLILAALVSILTNEKIDGGTRVAWILVTLALPLFGAIAWFLFGRKK